MKDHKIEAILYLINTVLFAVNSAINIYKDNDNTIIYIALSILFFIAGLSALKKSKKK
ncbi:MAG: hypothetical protein UHK60_07485 [Acutalibacteraceae bacterium]|nr:hypothetical protein [Acutalibacteraceae bacterium]